LYLVVEVADIAHNCLILHLLEVLECYDVHVARRSYVYVCPRVSSIVAMVNPSIAA
jgi:hypothetical protein